MTVQYSVKYSLVVIIGRITGVYVIQGLLQPEQRCHFHIIGLKISLAAKRMIPFCGG